jgi:hypothetical protein
LQPTPKIETIAKATAASTDLRPDRRPFFASAALILLLLFMDISDSG